MGSERALCVALLAGCFQPSPQAGARCSDEGRCPSGLECIGGTCELPGTQRDGAIDAENFVDAAIDAPGPDAMPLWAMPMPVPGVNTAATESDPSLTPNRLMIVFVRNNNLFLGTRTNTAQDFTVTELAILNTAADEASPELSADGNTLWFTSDRLVANDKDVYVAQRIGGVFAPASRIDTLSVAGSDEEDIAISPDGLTMIVGRSQLHRSTRNATTDAWPATTALGAGFGTSPAAPSLTAAGDLYFHADPTPPRNLYVARRNGTGFGTPMPLVDLNTTGRDAAPFIAGDESRLWFERNGDLYESLKN